MKSKLLIPGLLLALVTLVFSCKKDQKQTSSNTIAPPSAIYIAGAIGGNAVYWKNGTAVTLPSSTPAINLRYNVIADCVFISGDDVYFAGNGEASKGIDTPVYWKNGVLNILPEPQGQMASNYAIGVAGSNVYCAGGIYPANTRAGVLWNNNVANTFGGRQTAVNSITINNGDLYTSGIDQDGSSGSLIATYYKNQQRVLLNSNGMPASAYEVAVSGSDIYVAGWVNDSRDSSHAVYWKNGVMHMVGNAGSGAVSICVSGSDVYMCGTAIVNGLGTATYWKNDTAVYLVTNAWSTSECNQIRVWGDDVYAVGEAFYTDHGEQATLWKNGVGTIIGPYISFASAIAFKP